MFHPVSAFIGLRYLRGRSGDRFSRFVSYMSTAGITIGVMSLVTVLSVMNGFEAQLKGRILGVLPQAIVSYADGKTPNTSPLTFLINCRVQLHQNLLFKEKRLFKVPTRYQRAC